MDREQTIERYQALVPLTLKRLSRTPERYHEDMLGAGYVALVKAVDSYDPARGVQFPTYAITRITGAMLEVLRREDWVPRTIREAEKRGEPVQVLQQVSLETILMEGDEDLTLLNTVADPSDPPEVVVPAAIEAQVIRTLVRCLPRRERKVVQLYYWEEQTFQRIGERLGISESRAKQNHDTALMHLRLWMTRREEAYASG